MRDKNTWEGCVINYMETVSLIVYITIIVIGLFCRRNKVITILILAYMWCLIGLNTYTPDYAPYKAAFYGNGSMYALNMEIGFNVILDVFRMLGFTYQQFRVIWALFYIVLASNFIFRTSNSPNFVLSLMLICPTILDISGIRSCVAYLIVMNFALFLRNPSLKNKAIFLIGTLIAASIHTSALFYLVFILMGRKISKKKEVLLVVVISAIITIVYTPLFDEIVFGVYSITGLRIIKKWVMGGISTVSPNFIGIMSVALFLIVFVVLGKSETNYIICRETRDSKKIKRIGIDGNSKNTVNFLNGIGYYMLFLIPLITISLESRRLMYGALMAFYCLTSNALDSKKTYMRYTRKSLMYFFSEVIITIGVLWMYTYTYQSHNVMAALRDNILFGGIPY